MRVICFAFMAVVAAAPSALLSDEPVNNISRVLKPGTLPQDSRLGKLRILYDDYHPWVPADTRKAWEKQSQAIRERILVSNGLWPMPPKLPLKPIIHGRLDRDDYTVEKVFFASHPGHYVTGSLYRPRNITGKVPGILSPHGHWRTGRFYDAGENTAKQQIEQGAEKFMAAARFPLQARMVQLTRMGCVVFHYDMVGNADSKQIAHRAGFTDTEAGLRLQNFMGLQTFNSIRALDFLTSLPEVDGKRIGVTGASGGGTQTFMIGAIDPRPAAAFPAVMVSTAMQGGCVCENAEYLRIGINNIAIAALFAPRPMALSGADDWTVDIETKGYPELRQVYSLYGKTDSVYAKAFPRFKHNYNMVSRQVMFHWFNRHFNLNQDEPVVEREFKPLSREEMSVFNEQHPRPQDARDSLQLRAYLTEVAERQYTDLLPKNIDGVETYRRVVGPAARVMLDQGVPDKELVDVSRASVRLSEKLELLKGTIGRKQMGEQIPYVALVPEDFKGTLVLWIDGRGKSHLFDKKGQPTAAVEKLLDAGMTVAAADVFLTGEFVETGKQPGYPKVNGAYQGYTFGYNRPVLSNRVRDILTAIAGARRDEDVKQVHLVGTGDAGPWTLLAYALAADHVERAVVDAGGFSFGRVASTGDPMFLPGALKYGGLGGLAALAAPSRLTVAGMRDVLIAEKLPLIQVYRAAKGSLALRDAALTPDVVVDELLKD